MRFSLQGNNIYKRIVIGFAAIGLVRLQPPDGYQLLYAIAMGYLTKIQKQSLVSRKGDAYRTICILAW